MAPEKRYLFTLERRTNPERRRTSERRRGAVDVDLYQRLEEMRAAVASDRRRMGRRSTDR